MGFIVVTDLETAYSRILRIEDITDVGVSRINEGCHVRVKVKHPSGAGGAKYFPVRETVEEIARKLDAK